ncbi:NmrA family NAD(P)-binding protein [Rhizobium sp. S152]|uniref:NmrA family NAD(P)-binding protein n=1 Tax=Rhizobium sp. S152 TaxID=3055038 RepID=UPI0025A9BAA8|nr:NmrA family NAD(P)-binding protein [Rhizobium sp. S152]MDM9625210.1 NmrA family NAD(P)-binding protein [Rhizobium sp. S152]
MTEFDYVVLGASGHIGSVVFTELRKIGASALAVVHSQQEADEIVAAGGDASVVDICDADALRVALASARRAFLLNPPADPKKDTDAVETRTAQSIAAALRGTSLQKVLVVSTYGAQPGEKIGDLSVLFDFERMIEVTSVPAAINRGAYYFTNLDPLLEPAREGTITSPFPPDLVLPMVSPIDLGKAAVERLTSPIEDIGIRYVEGPARYTFADVATAFSDVLGHAVLLKTIPETAIERNYKDLGFSRAAANSFTRMTKTSIESPQLPESPIQGSVSLEDHITQIASTK